MSDSDRFDLALVLDRFQRSLATESPDDVLTDLYLEGYFELNKFFSLMGTVFGFVSSDVGSKIEILAEFRKRKEDADRFETFAGFMVHEKDSGLLKKTDYVSASRTLLRLHRGLGESDHCCLSGALRMNSICVIISIPKIPIPDFIREFLSALGELQKDEKTHTVCQAAYNRTLAAHHPWLVRKGAIVAMYTMPTRDALLNRVCVDVPAAIECLPQMLDVTRQVSVRTHDLYTLHDLHGLP